MEQLIEGRSGLDALDKSVKESFEITNAEGKKEYWEVKNSVVYVKLANIDNEHIIIARRIAECHHEHHGTSVAAGHVYVHLAV